MTLCLCSRRKQFHIGAVLCELPWSPCPLLAVHPALSLPGGSPGQVCTPSVSRASVHHAIVSWARGSTAGSVTTATLFFAPVSAVTVVRSNDPKRMRSTDLGPAVVIDVVMVQAWGRMHVQRTAASIVVSVPRLDRRSISKKMDSTYSYRTYTLNRSPVATRHAEELQETPETYNNKLSCAVAYIIGLPCGHFWTLCVRSQPGPNMPRYTIARTMIRDSIYLVPIKHRRFRNHRVHDLRTVLQGQ
ncbi:uncharacterized protein B0H18DRAFT_284649 [Fomitopsis serialis]|uniref:uncharacterized protein n=1 Tax=Fomitopsis serialis TaxID=139415 RepID=UPI002008679D|nr:uncharacterized protein B0H18DRAFT_284649 [Neoantrodia serialis]KAH9927683.1 hypothetical protein B0H18DRAFT_284649 [Neoantrodia serialis]